VASNGGQDLDWFWQIIDQAHGSSDRLRAVLGDLTKEEIYQFQDTFVELATELHDEPYRHYVDSEESEDGLEDIANVVVSRGEAAYSGVIKNPELMPPNVAVDDPTNLSHVAYQVYYDRFGEPLEVI
jgi:hypothetical protein